MSIFSFFLLFSEKPPKHAQKYIFGGGGLSRMSQPYGCFSGSFFFCSLFAKYYYVFIFTIHVIFFLQVLFSSPECFCPKLLNRIHTHLRGGLVI